MATYYQNAQTYFIPSVFQTPLIGCYAPSSFPTMMYLPARSSAHDTGNPTNDEVEQLKAEIKLLKSKVLWYEEERLRSLGRPQALHVKIHKELSFEAQLLSLGSLGSMEDFKETMSQLKFQFNSKDDREAYFSQFLPHIKENVRSDVSKKIAGINPKSAGVPATLVKVAKETSTDRERQGAFDFSRCKMICSTPFTNFPKLDHAFSKELVCIRLPSYDSKKLSFVLGIAENLYDDDEDDSPHELSKLREYSVTVLQHDMVRIQAMFRDTAKDTFQWDWLHGLIPSFRMHVACKHMHQPCFFNSIFHKDPEPWPEPQAVTEELNCPGTASLNEQQLSVVERISQTSHSGLHFLIGPPGTGKTTTIVSLLLERVKRYPEEKILLAAPSNKAVQVVLHRLLSTTAAVEPATESAARPMIALTGVMKDVPPHLEDIYVSKYKFHLIKPFQDLLRSKVALKDKQLALKDAHDLVLTRLDRLVGGAGLVVQDDTALETVHSLQAYAKKLSTKIKDIERKFPDEAALREHVKEVVRTINRTKNALEIYALQKAHVVFSTLVSSGRHAMYQHIQHFHTVLVDEASQALVPEVLITFKFQPMLMLLIGDPQQLPAYADSDDSAQCGFTDSLMLVMTQGAERPNVEMLTIQYRAHPSIAKWTSDQFYGGELVNHSSVLARASPLSALPPDFPLQQLPSAFIDVQTSEFNRGDGCICNIAETDLIVQTVRYLVAHGVKLRQIGVITFYASQVELLKRELSKAGVPVHHLAVSTVDGFQGDEKDFILVSCVRTTPHAGFLSDHRRINVALSRAKHARWVFGCQRALGHDKCNNTIKDLLGWTADPLKNDTEPPTQMVDGRHVWDSMGVL